MKIERFNLGIDVLLRRAMYAVYRGKCQYTRQCISFDESAVDHIIPQSVSNEEIQRTNPEAYKLLSTPVWGLDNLLDLPRDNLLNYTLASTDVNSQKNADILHPVTLGYLLSVARKKAPKILSAYSKLKGGRTQKPKLKKQLGELPVEPIRLSMNYDLVGFVSPISQGDFSLFEKLLQEQEILAYDLDEETVSTIRDRKKMRAKISFNFSGLPENLPDELKCQGSNLQRLGITSLADLFKFAENFSSGGLVMTTNPDCYTGLHRLIECSGVLTSNNHGYMSLRSLNSGNVEKDILMLLLTQLLERQRRPISEEV